MRLDECSGLPCFWVKPKGDVLSGHFEDWLAKRRREILLDDLSQVQNIAKKGNPEVVHLVVEGNIVRSVETPFFEGLRDVLL